MAQRISELKVLIRGGGEMASGIAHRLRCCHMNIIITEIAAPTAVRRTVAFAEAIYEGAQTIEGILARRASSLAEIKSAWRSGEIPVIVDAQAVIRGEINPAVIVDAIMAKKNCGTKIDDAELVIGVGPGFRAGANVHAVVESNRGYHLGRVIWDGEAEADTGGSLHRLPGMPRIGSCGRPQQESSVLSAPSERLSRLAKSSQQSKRPPSLLVSLV
jgi:xanthine dehydrogenase accessory factor